MDNKSYHIIYLNPAIEDERFSHLHRFLHPGNRNKTGWKSLLCSNLDTSHHTFLSCVAKNYSGSTPKRILLRYDLVDSILEVASHKRQLGFVDPEESLEEQLDRSE